MSESTKVPLAALPVPSTSFLSDAVFEHPGGEAWLTFEFSRDGVAYRGGLGFARVRAFRFRSEGHCTPWHVAGTYDTLAEVVESPWVRELLAAEPTETGGHWDIHHFMIYIDSAGCYEIGAASWSWLTEERIRSDER
jgi:hypothetical protein